MPLPRPATPRALVEDLRNFWQNRPRGQWIAAALAFSITTTIVVIFLIDSRSLAQPREQVMFLNSWPASRTDEQIRAQQRADQIERTRAERARQQEFRRIEQNMNRFGL